EAFIEISAIEILETKTLLASASHREQHEYPEGTSLVAVPVDVILTREPVKIIVNLDTPFPNPGDPLLSRFPSDQTGDGLTGVRNNNLLAILNARDELGKLRLRVTNAEDFFRHRLIMC